MRVTGGIGANNAWVSVLNVDNTSTLAGPVLITNSTTASSTTTGALRVTGGIGAGSIYAGGLYVSGPTTFGSSVTFGGTATYVLSTNTVYTDNLIELHTPSGGVGGTWASDDLKDIGFRFHYYNGGDANAALVLANDSKYLEWYGSGVETGGVFTGTYGTFKTGSIVLGNSTTATSTTTGALRVTGGIGASNAWVGSLTADNAIIVQNMPIGSGGTITGVAIGVGAAEANTALGNTAVGYHALHYNSIGNYNIAFGYNAGLALGAYGYNDQHDYNIAIGSAMTQNTISGSPATNNIALGQGAQDFVIGNNNIAIGYYAGSNDSGALGDDNIAIGTAALFNGTYNDHSQPFGNENIAIGLGSMENADMDYTIDRLVSSSQNISIGSYSGYNLNAATKNVFIGINSGQYVSTGSNNVIIGGYTGNAAPISQTGSNYIVLSDGAGNVRQYFDSNGTAYIGTSIPIRLSGDGITKAGNFYLTAGANTNPGSGKPGLYLVDSYSLTLYGGSNGITLDAYTNKSVTISQNTPSTSTTSGALVVAGGVGIGGNLNVGGRIAPRVYSIATTASLIWNSDSYDQINLTAQNSNLSIGIDFGNPINGQKIIIRIKSIGAYTLTLNTSGAAKSFRIIGASVPSTLTNGNTLYIACIYNGDDARWDVLAAIQGA